MESPLFQGLGLASGAVDAGGGDPVPAGGINAKLRAGIKPGDSNEELPLNKPKDTIDKIKIEDLRKINPANGLPFKKMGTKSANVNPAVVSAIIRQANAKGVDPNTALAIALQETQMGNLNEEVGSAFHTFPDEGIKDPYEQGANSMVKSLKDKLGYAKQLGFDKKGEAYALQAYNGYGKLSPKQPNSNSESFYEIPVTRQNPLNMAQNPVYGKTIISLRDEIIKKHPQIQALIKKEMANKNAAPVQSPALAFNSNKNN